MIASWIDVTKNAKESQSLEPPYPLRQRMLSRVRGDIASWRGEGSGRLPIGPVCARSARVFVTRPATAGATMGAALRLTLLIAGLSGWLATPTAAAPLFEACRVSAPVIAVIDALEPGGSLHLVARTLDGAGGDRSKSTAATVDLSAFSVRLADLDFSTLDMHAQENVSAGASREDATNGIANRRRGGKGAAAILARWVGRTVAVHPISSERDRWNRIVAHVTAIAGSQGGATWLQSQLVEAGRAMVRPEGSASGCAAALYRDERAARNARRGMWRGENAAILSARDPDLGQAVGHYRIVAGIVVSVGATARRHYLNFGRDWSHDFTVSVPARLAGIFRDAGKDPSALAGRFVRVRGRLKQWNGVVIDVRYPDEIELVGGGG